MLFGVFIGFVAVMGIVWLCAAYKIFYTWRHFVRRQFMTPSQTIEETPSVSVCIPARNEMHAMTECLESVLASTYPKLEVIVLDDRSEDTTSTLVKAFARDGVRFVEGKKLPDGWLGKNHALQGLLDEASGRYVLFMDVDTRLQPESIEQMVAYVQLQQVAMLSVMPRREDGWRASILFSPLRYFWEVMFHRRQAPATASNAWMIDRKVLIDEFRGFKDIKDTIQPETWLSSQLMAHGKYRFLLGDAALGVSYAKKWTSQLETSIRLLYPLLGRDFTRVIGALLGLLVLLTPWIILLDTIQTGWTIAQTIFGIVALAYASLYGAYLRLIWHRGWWIGALLLPVILVQEFTLIVLSTERYLLKTVTWKGRPIKTT